MPTVALTTLGCKVNQFETETMEGLFRQRGYTIVPFTERADYYVINTCSVTSASDRKSRQLIRRAYSQNSEAIIAVCGCYSQLAPDEVRAIEGVRVVLGTKERSRIVDYVEQAAEEDGFFGTITNIMQAREFEHIPLYYAPERTRAFLKIEDGCQNFCSFCIIPYARGPVKSRRPAHIREETEKLAAAGFKEIVLTGIHLGAYGLDFGGELTLADACREVLSVAGIERLRLGSLESIELSAELLELMKYEPRFCAHLHLPLQAGADDILKAMNRHYNKAEFAKLLADIKRAVPNVAISTDIIVGFPGETEEHFAEGLAFVEDMDFSRMHVFPYSPRTGTLAAGRKDQVADEVKKERVRRMQALARKKTQEYQENQLGKIAHVLMENNGDDEMSHGLTDSYLKVYTNEPVERGKIYAMKLVRLHEDGILGEICAG